MEAKPVVSVKYTGDLGEGVKMHFAIVTNGTYGGPLDLVVFDSRTGAATVKQGVPKGKFGDGDTYL